MAYAALLSISQTLEEILDSDPYFFPCAKEKAESFQETIASLIAFLDNCPPICTEAVNDLIKQIRDSAYEAEDVFESIVATHFLQKYGSESYEKFKMFPPRLEKVMEDIELLEKEVKKFHQDGNWVHQQFHKKFQNLTLASSSRQPTLRGNNRKMVALDKVQEEKLMEQLVADEPKLEVIPIVGMGGIGKTTLARILYDSKLIKESFDIRGWATISQTYNVQEIASGIQKDIRVPSDGNKDHLYQSLCGRKYLIVLDDVWDTQAWDEIKRIFPENQNGSRIMLTTRDSKVAAYANSFGTCNEMQLLEEDSSWSLLNQEIFGQNNCPPELVEIGKEIARQCQGLPLAISAIGGHLKVEKKLTEEYWKYVSSNISLVLKTTDDISMEILTLSYNYLPHHLKACFLYFGSFEEDETIIVPTIVQLWVAEGFVKPIRSMSMEEVAEEYLREIIERNLVLVYEYDLLGKPNKCRMHDLFRAICIKEAKKEKFLYIMNRDVPFNFMEINSQRRLILSKDLIGDGESPSSGIVSRNGFFSTTRSFIFFDHDGTSSAILQASGLLKILVVRKFASKFPIEVLELVNLKYLDLGDILEIPSSISRLRNLQTLDALSYSMPSEIWEMSQLRHLHVYSFRLPNIPDVQGKVTNAYVLNNLQSVSSIVDFECSEEVVIRIRNLKRLRIFYRSKAIDPSTYSLNNLIYLCQLESLCCHVLSPNGNLFANAVFPSSLKELVLRGCQIPWEQMTIIGILPNLEVLKLNNKAVKGKSWETNDGEFEKLKFLSVECSDLVEWKTEKDHFRSLRHLILKGCKGFEAFPSEILDIPTLERIELYDCSHAADSSANEMLDEDSGIDLIISDYDSY